MLINISEGLGEKFTAARLTCIEEGSEPPNSLYINGVVYAYRPFQYQPNKLPCYQAVGCYKGGITRG